MEDNGVRSVLCIMAQSAALNAALLNKITAIPTLTANEDGSVMAPAVVIRYFTVTPCRVVCQGRARGVCTSA